MACKSARTNPQNWRWVVVAAALLCDMAPGCGGGNRNRHYPPTPEEAPLAADVTKT